MRQEHEVITNMPDRPQVTSAAATIGRASPTLELALAGFAIGIAIGLHPWLAAVLLLSSLALARARFRGAKSAAVLVGFCAAGCALAPSDGPPRQTEEPIVQLEGTVVQISDRPHPHGTERAVGFLDVHTRRHGDVRVRFVEPAKPRLAPLWPGDHVRIRGTQERIAPADNPGMLDPLARLRADGIEAVVSAGSADNVELLESGRSSLRRVTAQLRAATIAVLQRALAPDEAALACALLVGQTRGMSQETIASYRNTGTLHFLAVSGMHLTLLLLFLRHVLLDRHGRRWWVRLAQAGFVMMYMGMTDFTPSVMRAGALALTVLIADLAKRRVALENCLLASALSLLLIDSRELFVVGFQLSLAATAAIVLLTRPIERLFDRGDGLGRVGGLTERWSSPWQTGMRRALSVSLAASIGTWPLCALHFGTIVPLAPLLSVLVVPLITMLMILFLLLVPWAALCLPGLPLLVAATQFAAWLLHAWLRCLDALPGTPVVEPAVVGAAFWLGLIAAFLFARGRPRTALVCAVLAALVQMLFAARAPRRPRMVALSVGHGLAVLFQSGDGTLLYDAGSRSRPDVGRRILVPALRSLGVRKIDVLVVSHFDSDHVNGIEGLIESFPPDQCLLPSRTDDRLLARSLIATLGASCSTLRSPGDGPWPERVGAFALRFSTARVSPARASNEESLVLRVTFGGTSVLLTGDIEESGVERAIRDGLTLATDVLFVPHHGLRCAGLPRLLRAAEPKLALVSGNLPTTGTRLGAVPILGTYEYGALFLETDGGGVGGEATGGHELVTRAFATASEVARIPLAGLPPRATTVH